MILGIDPGLDVTGIAGIDPASITSHMSVNAIMSGFLFSTSVATSPKDPMPVRLNTLYSEVRDEVIRRRAQAVFVEVPSFYGSYTGGPERWASVNKLFQAIGSILAGAQSASHEIGCVVLTRRASGIQKSRRHQILELAARTSGVTLPRGPRGGIPGDEWDATWIAVEGVIADGRTGGCPT